MLNERLLNILGGLLLFGMMLYICNGLAKQFDPQPLVRHYTHPTYTNEYVERLERRAIQYERQAKWYERGYEGITKILGVGE